MARLKIQTVETFVGAGYGYRYDFLENGVVVHSETHADKLRGESLRMVRRGVEQRHKEAA